MSDETEICFVIMPFGGYFDNYYQMCYAPAIQECGLLAHRADDMYRPSTIVDDIWVYTQKAKIILADITGKNPNVFYELGLAHALAKPAILITESIEDVPFDLRSLRIIERDKNNPNWGNSLKEKIALSIKETIQSPRNSVLPSFLRIDPASSPAVPRNEINNLRILEDLALIKDELARLGSRPSSQQEGRISSSPIYDARAANHEDASPKKLSTPAIHGTRDWRSAENHAGEIGRAHV